MQGKRPITAKSLCKINDDVITTGYIVTAEHSISGSLKISIECSMDYVYEVSWCFLSNICVSLCVMIWPRQHCHLSCQRRFRIYLNYWLIDWFHLVQYCSNCKQRMRKTQIKHYSSEKSHYVTWLTVWYCNHNFCSNWGTSWNWHYRAQFVLNPEYSFKIS